MNKKVLSAILFSALFAGTGTFTSCIDNDEPAGIEELRGAKAELLRAKVAVEQATAEYKKAEATYKLAEAAEKQADAKIKEATAKIKEAKAEAQAAMTAEAKVKAEAAIDSIQREMEVAALEHQATILTKKEALAVAERSYEIALKQIEIAKAIMSEKDQVAVSELVAAVERAQSEVNSAFANYQRVTDKIYGIQLQGEADSLFDAKSAALTLKYQKINLAAKEATLAKYMSFKENEGAETADWRAEIEEIEDSLNQLKKEMALIDLKQTEALYTDEYKAYEDTLLKAKEAVTAEKDTLKSLMFAEIVTDTLLYYGGSKNVVKKFETEEERAYVNVAVNLAGNKYDEAEDSLDYAGYIAELRAEYNSYTTERIYWLDSIKNLDAAAVEAASKKVDAAVKAWEDSLAAYNAAKNVDVASIKADAKTFIGSMTTPATGQQTVTVLAKKAAVAAFATKLAAIYNAIPANQVTYNVMKLQKPSYPATGTTTDDKKITEVLADATNQYHYMVYVLEYFGLADNVDFNSGTGVLDFELSTLGKSEANYDAFFTKTGAAAVAATATTAAVNAKSVLASLTQKEILDKTGKYTDDNFDANDYGVTLLGKLINASKNAFGAASLYVNSDEMTSNNLIQNGYLLNKPTLDDVRHAVKAYEDDLKTLSKTELDALTDAQKNGWKNVGIYGASLASSDAQVDFVANNHAAIKADLKAAIDKWTALVDDIRVDIKKANDDITAAIKVMDAAQKKLDDYAWDIKLGFIYEKSELLVAEKELKAIKEALIKVVNVYLPEGKPYTDAEAFESWLATQIVNAEGAVIVAEKAVAVAENAVKKIEAGIYTNSDALVDAQYEKARVEEELAKAEKALADALAALATAEEIWNAAE